MDTASDRLEFAPPPQPGLLRAFGLAVIAHGLLVLALMHGLQWQRESANAVAEAELWSALPQQAAPKVAPAPPPPPPKPVVRAPPPQPEPPLKRDADIAIEREKQQREAEKRKLAEEREQQRRKLEAQKKREEDLAKKKRDEELARKKQEQARQVAEAKRKEDERNRKEQEAKEAREAKRMAELREENMRRMQGMAGGRGAPGSEGSAAQSSGPSASWGGRVQARVRPNIVFPDNVSGTIEAVVEVRLAPDGTIVSRRIKKSSGNRGWDDAVLRALDRTEVLPRDTDGRVPPNGDLVFRPKP